MFSGNVAFAVIALSGVVTTTSMSTALTSSMQLAGLQKYFVRTDEVHRKAMDSIYTNMNSSSALRILEQHGSTSPALLQLAHRAMGMHSISAKKAFRGQLKTTPSYGGFQTALNLMNEMLYESMQKYDTEITICTDYYSKQCGILEGLRSDIAASNYKAASCREHLLASQSEISISEESIPKFKRTLVQHKLKCEHEITLLKKKLKIIENDIKVLETILEKTKCNTTVLMQIDVLHCESNCQREKFVSMGDEGLQQHLSQLKSDVALDLIQQSFSDMSEADAETGATTTQKTTSTNAPLKRTVVPDTPCNDPRHGAPSAEDKRAAKCTISTPQCEKIQERFVLIQASAMDERDDITNEIARMRAACKKQENIIVTQIGDEEQQLKDEQTKLAEAMECEANAGEKGRLGQKDHEEATGDLKKMMKGCSKNYQAYETEMCGLRKIRGELYKMEAGSNFKKELGLFQDCVLSSWDAEECSQTCGGGVQRLTRAVSTQPIGGAKCLPLIETKRCQDSPCPVDCKLEEWQGWSRCSAECGGGVETRLRTIRQNMKNNGRPCGETSQTQSCNMHSCESDCELSDWTAWSPCSKACDGGTRKRQKFIHESAVGEGSCPGKWEAARLEYKRCNAQACPAKTTTLTCKAMLDLVILIDGSGSLGAKGWAAEVVAAKGLVSAFDVTGSAARISVILFSGPRTWGGVYKCWYSRGRVNVETDCKVKVVNYFTERKDFGDVKTAIGKLDWPKGSTLTSLALGVAGSVLNSGRKDAKSVVAVITDGRPLSFRRTAWMSWHLRRKARLMWVPVTRYAPLRWIKSWATRRWQENVIPVADFDKLEKPQVINAMIADLCPVPE